MKPRTIIFFRKHLVSLAKLNLISDHKLNQFFNRIIHNNNKLNKINVKVKIKK